MHASSDFVYGQTCSGSGSRSYSTYTCIRAGITAICQSTTESSGSHSCSLYPGESVCTGGSCGWCDTIGQTCSTINQGTPAANCVISWISGGTPCGGTETWFTGGCSCSVPPPAPSPSPAASPPVASPPVASPPVASPPVGGSCDSGCGTCGFRDSAGSCTTDNACCHRVCDCGSLVCATVFGNGSNDCNDVGDCGCGGPSPSPLVVLGDILGRITHTDTSGVFKVTRYTGSQQGPPPEPAVCSAAPELDRTVNITNSGNYQATVCNPGGPYYTSGGGVPGG